MALSSLLQNQLIYTHGISLAVVGYYGRMHSVCCMLYGRTLALKYVTTIKYL